MRRIACLAFAGLTLIAWLTISGTPAARADVLSVWADLPVDYEFADCKGCDDDPVRGLEVGVNLPLLFGIGAAHYEVADDLTFDFGTAFLDLPVPFVNVVAGFGLGWADLQGGGFDMDGPAAKLWASLGWPIMEIFDLHVGYHRLYATVSGDDPVRGDDTDLDVGGRLITLGVRLGF